MLDTFDMSDGVRIPYFHSQDIFECICEFLTTGDGNIGRLDLSALYVEAALHASRWCNSLRIQAARVAR